MNRNQSIVAMPLLALLCLLALPNARAATYYIATNGVNTNPGSQALPFKTIQHGIDAAVNGDTLQVAAGTYFEHVLWNNKNLSLLGAGAGQSAIHGSSSGTCVNVGSSSAGILAGFTIQNASAQTGGGMRNSSSTVTVSNCVFAGNTGNGGGGMYNTLASPTVTSCSFFNNSAVSGSGMFNTGGASPIVTNCVFAGNSASYGGGAMFNQSSDPIVRHCTFTNNTANNGAGMYNQDASPTVSGCMFVGNTSVDAQSDGGAMHNDGQTLTSCRPLIINSTFISNNASWGGGAIYTQTGRPSLINCTFTGNGNIAVFNGYYCVATIVNCVFWGNRNSTNGPSAIYDNPVSPSLTTYSVVEGGWPGVGNLNANPLFINAAAGNLRLQPNSPCINVGNASATNLPAVDFDGAPRVVGGAPDLGAFETTPGLWFVDRTLGSDSNAGNAAAPFQSVTKAFNAAANGNSIYVKAGNYGSDHPRITKSLRLINWGNTGLPRIGQP